MTDAATTNAIAEPKAARGHGFIHHGFSNAIAAVGDSTGLGLGSGAYSCWAGS